MDWPPTYPIVRVDWLDAHTFTGWNTQAVLAEKVAEAHLEQNVTVGYLYQHDAEAVMVAQTSTDDGQLAEVTRIPRGMIRAMHYFTTAVTAQGPFSTPPPWGSEPPSRLQQDTQEAVVYTAERAMGQAEITALLDARLWRARAQEWAGIARLQRDALSGILHRAGPVGDTGNLRVTAERQDWDRWREARDACPDRNADIRPPLLPAEERP